MAGDNKGGRTDYGKYNAERAVDGMLKHKEEYVAGPLVFWFLDEVERRSKGISES